MTGEELDAAKASLAQLPIRSDCAAPVVTSREKAHLLDARRAFRLNMRYAGEPSSSLHADAV